MSRDNLSVVT